ncbi:MAG TPA: class I SAM-dependent methyltransferase [Candidatus Solibacter sp.]|jgi:SAM-dependent methyltransferase|nr:class I SAM-dependent methyltransferase [Candidatus Solibacter sp.]
MGIRRRLKNRLRPVLPPSLPDGGEQSENFQQNRKLWDEYAFGWTPEFRGYESRQGENAPLHYRHLGDEWGHPEDVESVVAEFILPFVGPGACVAELGSGGGRVAARVLPHVREMWCFDISEQMLARARDALGNDPRANFVLLDRPEFPADQHERFDFVYSFDVFVHLDLHMMWRYLQEFVQLVKPGGAFMFHTSNIATAEGWRFFASQERFTIPTHYFVHPGQIETMLSHLPVEVVTRSDEDPSNFYLARDYLVVCRRNDPR